jgi:hypothetical protein
MILPLLLACADERGPREADDPVLFYGYVYQHAIVDDSDVPPVTDATITFSPEGEDPVAATQSTDREGVWSATLPPGKAMSVRIEGEGMYPSVFAGTSPDATAIWFNGAIFGSEQGFVDAWLAELDVPEGVTAAPPDADTVDVWGYPLDGQVWDCADVRVNGAPPLCYYKDDTGTLVRADAGPIDAFYAFGLPPGDIVVESGLGGEQHYATTGGEMVYAWWFQGAPE